MCKNNFTNENEFDFWIPYSDYNPYKPDILDNGYNPYKPTDFDVLINL